jgi:Ca-activated chloride channel homolog
MSFSRSWILLFALAPLAWAAWQWTRTSRRLALVLHTLALLAIIGALAEPSLQLEETRLSVVALVDTSVSLTAEDLRKQSERLNDLERAKGRHQFTVIPFASQAREASAAETKGGWKLQAASRGGSTNLEEALRTGIGALQEGLAPRMVLLSDGRENEGSVARALNLASQLQVPVDAYWTPGRQAPELRITEVNAPGNAFAGEKFDVNLVVEAKQPSEMEWEIAAEGVPLAKNRVTLQAGRTLLKAAVAVEAEGALRFTNILRAQGREARADRMLVLRRPKLLYVSEDPAGTEGNLVRLAEAGRFSVQRVNGFREADLAGVQVCVLNNVDLVHMSAPNKAALEAFVRRGGGLLSIGGERNLYEEAKPGAPPDLLARTLPAVLAPPRSPEGTLVVLIMDKSSSMEGRKMELARTAGIGVIENLRPQDTVGVLIFDNSWQWAVPIRKAEDRALIKRLIAGVTPDGGTQIAPALSEAFRRTLPVKATFKHIVLLTDGISEEGDSISVSREAKEARTTISTVGLGQDVNKNYLEKVASISGGKSYFLNDPSGLEQILIKDVMEFTGSTAVEKPMKALMNTEAEIVRNLNIAQAPSLRGYVKFEAKPEAERILDVETGEASGNDPLLTRWQYGLGRSAVFASDAKARWAQDWIGWQGFDRFWSNVLHDLLPHASPGQAQARYNEISQKIEVEYRLSESVLEPAKAPEIFVLGPGDYRAPLNVERVAPRLWRASLAAPAARGVYRIRPLTEDAAFPETGLYREEAELQQTYSGERVMQQVASYTGGRYQPRAADVFNAGGRKIISNLTLWPALLAAALLLNLSELVLRKWLRR